jgi:hypothetical protein
MRNHYHLPAQLGSFAVTKFNKAKEIALKAKKDFLAKEGAVAILRQESKGIGLIYEEYRDRSSFNLPVKHEQYWLIKPKKSTLVGKRIQGEMDHVCELLEVWQWSLENALSLYESVYANRQFELTVCVPMADGSVLIRQSREAKKLISEDYKITELEYDHLRGFANA